MYSHKKSTKKYIKNYNLLKVKIIESDIPHMRKILNFFITSYILISKNLKIYTKQNYNII